jgi:hypothetical protein
MDENSIRQQQESQPSLTSTTASPSITADPVGDQSIQDGPPGHKDQEAQIKDYFVCSFHYMPKRA